MRAGETVDLIVCVKRTCTYRFDFEPPSALLPMTKPPARPARPVAAVETAPPIYIFIGVPQIFFAVSSLKSSTKREADYARLSLSLMSLALPDGGLNRGEKVE